MTESQAPLGPLARYQQAVAEGTLLHDESQLEAMQELQTVYDQLVSRDAGQQGWLGSLLTKILRRNHSPIQGLYLWGGVGRGKTCLMDQFFISLPFNHKLRLHFHRFMQMVHTRLREVAGQSDPLIRVAEGIAQEANVLCFDEFYVSDIGDAMILANLLDALFAKGVVLVATSNLKPDLLYKDGLQRKKFLPAIALLNQFTKVINLDGGMDYRMRSLQKDALYHFPAGPDSERKLSELFDDLARGQACDSGKTLEIQGRKISCLKWSQGVVWFAFTQICQSPRGTADYVELATLYHTVLISGVPEFKGTNEDEARRFIALVDEFYDHNVKLALTAAVPIARLYQSGVLAFSFDRTASRLVEMQTREYLTIPHKPD